MRPTAPRAVISLRNVDIHVVISLRMMIILYDYDYIAGFAFAALILVIHENNEIVLKHIK